MLIKNKITKFEFWDFKGWFNNSNRYFCYNRVNIFSFMKNTKTTRYISRHKNFQQNSSWISIGRWARKTFRCSAPWRRCTSTWRGSLRSTSLRTDHKISPQDGKKSPTPVLFLIFFSSVFLSPCFFISIFFSFLRPLDFATFYENIHAVCFAVCVWKI